MELIFDNGRSVTLPDGFNVNISGKDYAFRWENYPDNAIEHLLKYGPTQNLNDGHALPKGASQSEHWAKAMKRNDALLAGTFRQVGDRIGDPVKAYAIEYALENVVKVKWAKAKKTAEPKAMRAEAIAIVERNPAYMSLAQKHMDEAKELAEMIAESELALDEEQTEAA